MPPGKGMDNKPVELGNGPQRTEFIILFIWKEPIPSDSLRQLMGGAPAAGGAQNKNVDQPKSRSSRGKKKTQTGG